MNPYSTMTTLDLSIETLHNNRKTILASLQRAASCQDELEAYYRDNYLDLAARGMILHAKIIATLATL